MEHDQLHFEVYDSRANDTNSYTLEEVMSGKFPFHEYIRQNKDVPEFLIDLAMKHEPHSIRELEVQTEKNQLTALISDTTVFPYLKNPSDTMKFFAMSLSSSSFVFIDKPTKEMKEFAISKNPSLILSLVNGDDTHQITEDLLFKAMKISDNANAEVIYKSLPLNEELNSERVVYELLKKNGNFISLVLNPTLLQEMTAAELNPMSIFEMKYEATKEIPLEVMKMASKSDDDLLLYNTLKFIDEYDELPKEIKDIYKHKIREKNKTNKPKI